MSDQQTPLETDPRFPSGPWVGFFTHQGSPKKYRTELRLTFSGGIMVGDGLDFVGIFTIRGRYHLEDGKCYWTKQYVGKHAVEYRGFNEGKGIWGTWVLTDRVTKGGFYIWPEGIPDPTQPVLRAEVDLPNEVEQPERNPVLV